MAATYRTQALRRRNGLALILSATHHAPASARRAVERITALDGSTRETLKLLVSELVTNAVCHAALGPLDPIHVTISTEPVIRVEVTDGGPGFDPVAVRRTRRDTSGWGLLLVEHLATCWGVDADVPGRVWFELTP